MKNNTKHSNQNYLKHIYELSENGGSASTTQLAVRLEVSPASVTGMLQKLAAGKQPLIIYKKHHGAILTKAGEKIALNVIRHHRLLETFMVQALGFAWDEVHEEACRLEHVISENFEYRMDAALGHPTHDPHGSPIPGSDLSMPSLKMETLGSLQNGESTIIQRVSDEDSALLRTLKETGIVPGAKVTFESYSGLDGKMSLWVEGKEEPVVLDDLTTSKIYIIKGEK